MRDANRWDRLRQLTEQADRFLLTSHVFPEGDAIGSEVALALHLRDLGKQVLVLNDGAVQERYRFLTRLHPVHSFGEAGAWPDPGWVEVAICLDVSSWDYLGPVGRWIRQARPIVISIDHHQLNGAFGDLDVVLEKASSTGEVLYRYFRAVGAPVTPEIAEALYASLLFDTWGFRLPNASNDTVRIAAELLACGVDHRSVCARLFETDSRAKLDLLRLSLAGLRTECDGKLAWLVIPSDLFHAAGASFMDSDGILDHLLGLGDVEICAMFRQQDSRGVKATFRSKGRYDVGRLAAEMGGGGRTSAAGVLLPLTLHGAIDRVLPTLRRMLDPQVLAETAEETVAADGQEDEAPHSLVFPKVPSRVSGLL